MLMKKHKRRADKDYLQTIVCCWNIKIIINKFQSYQGVINCERIQMIAVIRISQQHS